MSSDTHSETKRGRRCVAGGCSSTHLDGVSLHYFPFKKEPHLVPKWTAFVRLKRKWPEGPTRYSSLCELHFDDSCYPFEYQFKKSQGIPVKLKFLNPGSVPTKHHPSVLGKRDLSSIEADEKSNEREKKERKRIRGAFVKRENFRIIAEKTEVQNKSMQEAEARKSSEDLNCTMTDNENNKSTEELSKSKEAFSQTKRSWNRIGKSIQTKSETSTKGTQINMYPARRSVGIQCNIKENAQPMNDQFLRYEDDMPPESSNLEISSDFE
ncbi:uncharacterized protein LOC134255235 [Saccostrea cucullata]|uniref:uncharacterized protein LOC134255235 n=1 Tax=Saccostrea cuccullata TaxID=36930 RepID=UPI002ED2E784